jgi:hypothetical protein
MADMEQQGPEKLKNARELNRCPNVHICEHAGENLSKARSNPWKIRGFSHFVR